MRGLVSFVVMMASIALVVPDATQEALATSSYLAWSAAEAERIGRSTRVGGRVGGAFDFRVTHTEHAFNYKLRATWLTTDVIQATARLLQLSERLTDIQTVALVMEATAAGGVVIMVEVDPREVRVSSQTIGRLSWDPPGMSETSSAGRILQLWKG